MFKHIVMWRLKDFAEGATKQENAVKLKTLLTGLKDKIPEIKHIEVGIDLSQTPRSYDVVLYSAFENQEDCRIYMKHPEHVLAGSFVGKVTAERILVDYEA
ncbi:MAG: Dabb family protein [Desulfobacteraceae bacterium]|nr:Dabb family protein [Desulfobacteraceae bacterium]MBU4054862.1 Dabb family protein [Pseudomonadota bacterium]